MFYRSILLAGMSYNIDTCIATAFTSSNDDYASPIYCKHDVDCSSVSRLLVYFVVPPSLSGYIRR